MKNCHQIFIYGFALFAMFFGSGNLVFPLQIGHFSGQYWLFGFMGLLLTGIFLPFLGLAVIKIHRGNYLAFFNEAGKFAGFFLPLFTLSLLGAFGVVPRCITVAHGGISDILPNFSLTLFSLIFCFIMYLLCLNEKNIISALGKWLSPILVLALLTLIYMGIKNASPIDQTIIKTPFKSLKNGFSIGYQTMDLFAAFFFSALVLGQMEKNSIKKVNNTLAPSIIGATLLSIIYLGLVFLGAHYGFVISDLSPEQFLPAIARYTMGQSATWLIAIAMIFSCLTTAIALNNIYANYLCNLFNLDNKKFPIMLLFITLISFIVSLRDFSGIAAFLAPALEVSYPGIIALTIFSIFTKEFKKLKWLVFYTISGFMFIKHLFF